MICRRGGAGGHRGARRSGCGAARTPTRPGAHHPLRGESARSAARLKNDLGGRARGVRPWHGPPECRVARRVGRAADAANVPAVVSEPQQQPWQQHTNPSARPRRHVRKRRSRGRASAASRPLQPHRLAPKDDVIHPLQGLGQPSAIQGRGRLDSERSTPQPLHIR